MQTRRYAATSEASPSSALIATQPKGIRCRPFLFNRCCVRAQFESSLQLSSFFISSCCSCSWCMSILLFAVVYCTSTLEMCADMWCVYGRHSCVCLNLSVFVVFLLRRHPICAPVSHSLNPKDYGPVHFESWRRKHFVLFLYGRNVYVYVCPNAQSPPFYGMLIYR
jgi:hypothetical protein